MMWRPCSSFVCLVDRETRPLCYIRSWKRWKTDRRTGRGGLFVRRAPDEDVGRDDCGDGVGEECGAVLGVREGVGHW